MRPTARSACRPCDRAARRGWRARRRRAPSTCSDVVAGLQCRASAAGPSGTTAATFSRPPTSYSARSKSSRRAGRATCCVRLRRRRDAHVRRVQLAEHQRQDAAHLVRRPRAGDARLVHRRARRPSRRRSSSRRRTVAQIGPRLAERPRSSRARSRRRARRSTAIACGSRLSSVTLNRRPRSR